MQTWIVSPVTVFIMCVAFPASLRADPITVLMPVVSGAVNDVPVDGIGDSLSTAPFISRVDRPGFHINVFSAILEFDVSSLAHSPIHRATIAGTIESNNSLDTGTREIALSLFVGDGQLTVADFAITAQRIGTVQYHPTPTGPEQSVSFSFPITAALHDLLDNGAMFAGIRFDAVNFQAPSALSQPFTGALPHLAIDSATTPEPTSLLLIGTGLAVLARRRGHHLRLFR